MKQVVICLAAVSLSVAGICVAASSDVTSTTGHAVGNAGCSRVDLLERPGYTTSGAWTTDGEEELLLGDALNRTILRYSSTGRPLGPLVGPIGSALANLAPSRLKVDGMTQRLLLEVQGSQGGSRVVSLGRSFRPEESHAVESSSFINHSKRLSGFYQWEPVGSDLVTFSDIQGPREIDWNSGIVRFPLGDPEHFTELQSIGRDNAERAFYRLGYQYITSLEQTAYVLRMENNPQIYKDVDENGAKSSILIPLSVGASLLDPTSSLHKSAMAPPLPAFHTRQDFVTVMATVERSVMPIGIYGWQGYLFVVWRFPEGRETSWLISKFAPTGKLVGAARIPSRADHLTPVPGPKFWAFVEKGRVDGFGIQKVNTILFVSAALFGRMPSPSPSASAKMIDARSICQ